MRLSEPKTVGGRSVTVNPQPALLGILKEIRVSRLIKAKERESGRERKYKAMVNDNGSSFICVYETEQS